MFWLYIALLGALMTSLTTILAKIGIKNVNSDFATAYRTGVVIVFSFILCLISGNLWTIPSFSPKNWIFLSLSGVATGLSWLCYYKALKMGSVNKVAPIDKSGFIMTSILFLIFFFDSTTKGGNILTIIMLFVSMTLMLVGTVLMIDKKADNKGKEGKWLLFAILSAVFASFVSLFVKIGLSNVKSDVGTFIRTIVVFFFAITIVLVRKEYIGISKIDGKSWIFLTLSGIATGGAWLFEYTALNMRNVSPVAVNSIGKFSILLTMAFCRIILKEKFSKKAIIGLGLLVLGIAVVTVFSL